MCNAHVFSICYTHTHRGRGEGKSIFVGVTFCVLYIDRVLKFISVIMYLYWVLHVRSISFWTLISFLMLCLFLLTFTVLNAPFFCFYYLISNKQTFCTKLPFFFIYFIFLNFLTGEKVLSHNLSTDLFSFLLTSKIFRSSSLTDMF